AGTRLNALILDLQEYAKVRNAEEEVSSVNLEDAVREAIVRLDQAIANSGARIVVTNALPRVMANRTWANQAVFNLISNAIKFAKPGAVPQIVIEAVADAERGEAGLCVLDRGIGVPDDRKESVFTLFHRFVGR